MNAAHTFYTSYTRVPADPTDPMSHKVKTRPLNQTIHPEEKRKIIGDTFMKVSEPSTKPSTPQPNHPPLNQTILPSTKPSTPQPNHPPVNQTIHPSTKPSTRQPNHPLLNQTIHPKPNHPPVNQTIHSSTKPSTPNQTILHPSTKPSCTPQPNHPAPHNQTIHSEEKRKIIGDTFIKVSEPSTKPSTIHPLKSWERRGRVKITPPPTMCIRLNIIPKVCSRVTNFSLSSTFGPILFYFGE